MVKIKGLRVFKVLMLTAFAVFGLSFNLSHVASASAASMTDMPGHSSSPTQCQTICTSALPTEKQDRLQQVKRNNESPEPAVYLTASLTLSLIALTFIVKIVTLLSSWRPPDLIKLNGQYLLYA
jgi:hypothetical protein